MKIELQSFDNWVIGVILMEILQIITYSVIVIYTERFMVFHSNTYIYRNFKKKVSFSRFILSKGFLTLKIYYFYRAKSESLWNEIPTFSYFVLIRVEYFSFRMCYEIQITINYMCLDHNHYTYEVFLNKKTKRQSRIKKVHYL